MCMLDCLLVSAICFYMYKAKNMNGRRYIFTEMTAIRWTGAVEVTDKLTCNVLKDRQ